MIKKLPPSLFLFLLLCSSFAYSQHTLQGTIADKSGNPVPYATIILLNEADSTTVYKGGISGEQGNFLFEEIEANTYVLKISFVGYKNHLQRIEILDDKDLGHILLEEDVASLEEVAITVKNPTIKREVDRLVFKVENTTLSTGNSWQILQKTPGVIETGGNLQVRNQSVTVYINDRKVQLTSNELRTLLQNYSAENIESVEVITNPPAKYDAEGGAILNIVTSKSISPGYKGSVNASYTQAIFPKYSFGTSHYTKTDNLNFFANYSFNPGKKFKEDLSYINFINDQGTVFSRWNSDFERTTRIQSHNANVILDYDLNKNNALAFSAYTVISPGKTFDNTAITSINDNLPETANYYTTKSGLEEDLANLAFNLKYTHKFSKSGSEISAKAHYTYYDQKRVQNVSTTYFNDLGNAGNSDLFFTDAAQAIDIYTGQIDFVTPLGSTNFETGAKASVIESESGIDFFDTGTGSPNFNPSLSDQFNYQEHIYAAYASIAKDWEKWSLKIGLRGEYTDRKGNSQSAETVESREYFDFFPTFYLLHRINNNNSISFDFSRRIQRPDYSDLNPFRYFINENNFNAGNPNLRAAISNNFSLSYTLQNAYFFSVYYRDNGGFPQTLSFQDNDNLSLRRIPINLLESQSYGLDLTHGRSLLDFWYTYAYVSLFHEEETFLALESNNARVTNEINGVYASWYNSFTLSKDGSFSGQLTLLYVSDWMTGSYQFEPWTTLSLGLRKTLWNNRAEISLHVEDILNSTNTRLTSQYLNQDNSFFAQPESRYVRVGFKYNFGNFRLSDNQRALNTTERDRL